MVLSFSPITVKLLPSSDSVVVILRGLHETLIVMVRTVLQPSWQTVPAGLTDLGLYPVLVLMAPSLQREYSQCCPEGNRIRYEWSRLPSRKQSESWRGTRVLWRAADSLRNSCSWHRMNSCPPPEHQVFMSSHTFKEQSYVEILLFPGETCLSEPVSALFSVGKAAPQDCTTLMGTPFNQH